MNVNDAKCTSYTLVEMLTFLRAQLPIEKIVHNRHSIVILKFSAENKDLLSTELEGLSQLTQV